MKWMKRAATSLLVAIMVVLQMVSPAFAQETSAMQKKPETLVGELCVYTQGQGVHKVDAALYDETMILVSPQTAATLADAELVDGGNGQFEFWRDHYVVQVDTNTGKIDIGLYAEGVLNGRLYDNEQFTLQEIQTVQFGKEKTPAIPLEQMLYLLNAQWLCAEDCVYIYNPPETLWNVVGDLGEMDEVLPSPAEILGDTVLKKWGNSFKYGLLAFADEVAPEYLIPIVGDDYWSQQKMEEALLTLAVPCENIMGSLQEEAQNASNKFVSDISGLVGDISSLGGGAVSVANKLTKSVTAWSDVKIPEGISKTFSTAGFAAQMAKAIATAGRYENWGESYRSQLEYLSQVKNDKYAEYCKDLNKVAGSLAKEYGNFTDNVVKESLELVFSNLGGTLLNKTPAGLVFSSYDLAHAFVEAYIPAAKTAQQAGDNASAAMRLNDLAVLMRAQYAAEFIRVGQMGTLNSTEDVAQLRFIGSLMMEASAHSHDALYSAWKNMYLAGYSDASEEEIRQNAGETISMDALAGKLIQNQTSITRFEETSQYDPSLLLYGDMNNLYSETEGAHREKIPPEYVKIKELPVFSSNIAEYQGSIYVLNNRSIPGLTNFSLKPAAYDYICGIAFYKERLYYSCKTTGTSEISSAIYSCNLDGSDQKLLADCPLGSGKADCTSFLIQAGKLYYGYYGEQYVDLETGEMGDADTGEDLDAANRLVDHRQASVVYAQDGLYYRGEINIRAGLKGNKIYFASEEEESETVVYENAALRSIKIEMVTPQEIYFSASQSGGNQCLLMKFDLETGQAETLDSRPEAGSGGYFAW